MLRRLLAATLLIAAPVIADACMKGIRGFDANAALGETARSYRMTR